MSKFLEFSMILPSCNIQGNFKLKTEKKPQKDLKEKMKKIIESRNWKKKNEKNYWKKNLKKNLIKRIWINVEKKLSYKKKLEKIGKWENWKKKSLLGLEDFF